MYNVWLMYIVGFLLMILKKMTVWFRNILKVNESNSFETIDNRTNLTNQTKFRFNKNP